MRFLRRKSGLIVPEQKDPLEERADEVSEEYGLDPDERERFIELQRAMNSGDRALQKRVVKRLRAMERASHMSPTISTTRRK